MINEENKTGESTKQSYTPLIAGFEEVSKINFFGENYATNVKNVFFREDALKEYHIQLEDLEDRYIGNKNLGTLDSPADSLKKGIPLEIAESFDKIFMNGVFNHSLEGKLEGLNGYKDQYHMFHTVHLKNNNSGITYENRKSTLTSLETLSQWVSGQDVGSVEGDLKNINEYLTQEITENPKIDELALFKKRQRALFRKHREKSEEDKNPYDEFCSFTVVLNKVFDSMDELGEGKIGMGKETLIKIHDDLTEDYRQIVKNESIGESLKEETGKLYLSLCGKMYLPIHNSLTLMGEILNQEKDSIKRKYLISNISSGFELLNDLSFLEYKGGEIDYITKIPRELEDLAKYSIPIGKGMNETQ